MHGERRRLRSMLGNSCMLDANAVLRFLLKDIDEQFQQVRTIIRTKKCYVTLEVLAEVCYVLEGVYQVSRENVARNFRKLNNDVSILNADVLLRALEIYDIMPKLDFVDCILYGYNRERGIEIVTFDKKLKKRMEDINKTDDF